MIYVAGGDEHEQERQPGFGVNAEFLTALSDLVIDNGDLWGLKCEDDAWVLMKGAMSGKADGLNLVTRIEREIKLPETLSRLLDRIVRTAKRETRQQIQDALGIRRER